MPPQQTPQNQTSTDTPVPNDQPLVQTPAPIKPNKNSKKLIIIILAVLLICGIATALFMTVLKKKPAANNATGSNTTSQSATSSTPKVKTCLVPSDYNSLFGYDNDINFTADNMYTDNVHFKPDSSAFDDETGDKSTVDNFIEWYTKIKDTREVKYNLEGSTNDVNADANSIKLAKARAEKVKADMVAGGVPASAITTSTYARKQDTALGTQDRVVIISVDPTCTAKKS